VQPSPYRVTEPREPEPASAKPADLGARRSVHALRFGRKMFAAVLPAAIVLLVGATLVKSTGLLALWVTAPMALVLLVFFAIPVLVARGTQVELYTAGVVVVRRTARDEVLFEDVNEVWWDLEPVSSPMGRYARILALRLVTHAGTKHRVPIDVDDGVTVCGWIVRKCSDPLLGEARRALRAGETLRFGPVHMTRDSIRIGRASAGWSDIRRVLMQSGRIVFFRRLPVFPWRTVSWDRVPHPTVLARLVAETAKDVQNDLPLGMREA
jgi:hypothetical protein